MVLHTAADYATTGTVNALWLLVAAALVLLMTPGVAFFYGGMVRAKSVISMMMMSFGAMALVGVLWVLYGYGLSFGKPSIPGVLGTPDWFLGSLMGKDGMTCKMMPMDGASMEMMTERCNMMNQMMQNGMPMMMTCGGMPMMMCMMQGQMQGQGTMPPSSMGHK